MTDPDRMERLARLVCEYVAVMHADKESTWHPLRIDRTEALAAALTEGADHAAERNRGLSGEVGDCYCDAPCYYSEADQSDSDVCLNCYGAGVEKPKFLEAIGALWGAVMRAADAMSLHGVGAGLAANSAKPVPEPLVRGLIESLNAERRAWLDCKESL